MRPPGAAHWHPERSCSIATALSASTRVTALDKVDRLEACTAFRAPEPDAQPGASQAAVAAEPGARQAGGGAPDVQQQGAAAAAQQGAAEAAVSDAQLGAAVAAAAARHFGDLTSTKNPNAAYLRNGRSGRAGRAKADRGRSRSLEGRRARPWNKVGPCSFQETGQNTASPAWNAIKGSSMMEPVPLLTVGDLKSELSRWSDQTPVTFYSPLREHEFRFYRYRPGDGALVLEINEFPETAPAALPTP